MLKACQIIDSSKKLLHSEKLENYKPAWFFRNSWGSNSSKVVVSTDVADVVDIVVVVVLRSSVEVVGLAVENISIAVVEIIVFIAFVVWVVVVVVVVAVVVAVLAVVVVVVCVVIVVVVVVVVVGCGLVVGRVVSRDLLFGSLTGILRRGLVRNNYFSLVQSVSISMGII